MSNSANLRDFDEWRQQTRFGGRVLHGEFDVCELSLATHVVQVARGTAADIDRAAGAAQYRGALMQTPDSAYDVQPYAPWPRIVTKNDFDFCEDLALKAKAIMTKDVITGGPGVGLREAYRTDDGDSVTIAQDGKGRTSFTSGDSTIYSTDGKAVSCDGTGPDAECIELPMGNLAGGLLTAFTSIFAGLGKIDSEVYGGELSDETIAGRSARCATFTASDFAALGGLGSDGWTDLKSDFVDMMTKKQLNTIIQVGLQKEKELPGVPLLIDQAKNTDDRAVLEFLTKGNASIGKPFATSPGVPAGHSRPASSITATSIGSRVLTISMVDDTTRAPSAGTFSSPVSSEQGTPLATRRSRPSRASRRSGAR